MVINRRWTYVGLGILVGGLIGVIIGILSTPRTGPENRLQVSEGMRETHRSTRRWMTWLVSQVRSSLQECRSFFGAKWYIMRTALQAGRKAAQRSQSVSKEIVG